MKDGVTYSESLNTAGHRSVTIKQEWVLEKENRNFLIASFVVSMVHNEVNRVQGNKVDLWRKVTVQPIQTSEP